MSIKAYFQNTAVVAQMLGEMFQKVFPLLYESYRKAFEARASFHEDPGPWLGQAIVYKVDSKLHSDKKDFGPAACIPFGFYEGGHMLDHWGSW